MTKGNVRTGGNARTGAFAIFACLAIIYLSSVFLQVSGMGWSWTIEFARANPNWGYSLALRFVGGVISLIVFALICVGSRWETLRVFLAWILALGVMIVVVIDNLFFRLDPEWLVGLIMIAVHLIGAMIARRRKVE